MKPSLFQILVLVVLCASCGEDEFGFRNNPLNVLINATKIFQKRKFKQLDRVLTKGAFCLWTTPANSELIRHNLDGINPLRSERNYDLKVIPLSNKKYEHAHFVGFWSYYMDDYNVVITEKSSGKIAIEVKLECEFGITGTRSDKDKKKSKASMPEKRCKIVEITPHSFTAPPMTEDCRLFTQSQPL